VLRDHLGRALQVTQDDLRRGIVFLMERQQLVQDVRAVQAAGMMVQAAAHDHLEHAPHRAVGDAATDVARIHVLLFPQLELAVEVRVALDQVVGYAQAGRPQPRVAKASQRSGLVDFIALIARREQARAAGDGVGVRVVFDRTHLSSQFTAANDVDAGMREEQQIGRFYEDSGQFPLDLRDLLGLGFPIVVQCVPHARQIFGQRIGVGGIAGPGQHTINGARLAVDFFPFFPLGYAPDACGEDRLGRAELSRQRHGDRPRPQIVVGKNRRVAWQATFEIIPNLTLQLGPFVDEIPSMPRQQLQL